MHTWKINTRLLGLCVFLCCLFITPVSAQNGSDDDFGGGPIVLPMDLTTDAEFAEIEAEVARNIAKLSLYGMLPYASSDAVSFSWPLRAAPHLTDYGYHGVSGFVDHDPNSYSLLDYMCSDRTYDVASTGYDHRGTDYFTYPFPWLKMDNMDVEIIAAAPGTIVFKRDGQFDRQCGLSGAYSNAVVLRHEDDTITWYLHMKAGSLTSKAVGATVAAGEYLGIVGSSGSSTGPHLHFEVRTPANDDHIDPYEGPCNTRPSMWVTQPPYYDSAVIAVHTGSDSPYNPYTSCGEQENTNIQTTFEADDTVYFVTYYRDLLEGQESTYRIIQPDGSTYRTWDTTSTNDHYTVAYRWWARSLDDDGPPPLGNWRFEVDFEGETYQTHFYVGGPLTITIKTPNGGEAWRPGTLGPITWDTNLPEDNTQFWIDLYENNTFHSRIYTATPSSGFYFWGIPVDLPPSDTYTINILDMNDPNIYDWSDAPFTIAPMPDAQFTFDPYSGTAPLTVTFTDTSASLIDTWSWEFGDSMTSTHQHPTHTYTDPGVYSVTLGVAGPTGSDVLTHTHAITVSPPPLAANFHAIPILGTPPFTVTLFDDSQGPPVETWTWSFGDGITSTVQNPTHVYSLTGLYSVSLHVTAGQEEDTKSLPDYIHVVDQLWPVYLPLISR